MLLKNGSVDHFIDQWVNEEIKEEIRKYLETNENGNTLEKSIGCSKSYSKKEVHRDTGLPQEMRKISNKPPNLPPKGIRKRRINKS